MAEPILEAKAVHKTYPRLGGMLRRRIGTIEAVDGVSCALAAGETLGLVGESGCGKSTLAKLLLGLLSPSAGDVFIQERPWSSYQGAARLAARRSIQGIFQHPFNSLDPRMTVEQILDEPLQIHRSALGAARRSRIEALLDTVQLPATYRRRLPRELSGGECQRVGIARALATEPSVLICDEPISSLDISVGAQILELLRGFVRKRRTALLFISHDLRAVASLCDRIAVMREGRLVECAPTDQLLNRPAHPYTQLLLRSAALELDG